MSNKYIYYLIIAAVVTVVVCHFIQRTFREQNAAMYKVAVPVCYINIFVSVQNTFNFESILGNGHTFGYNNQVENHHS